MNNLLSLIIGLALVAALFFLGCYLLMLSWNASMPLLFTFAREEKNFWVFVIFALFLVLAGAAGALHD